MILFVIYMLLLVWSRKIPLFSIVFRAAAAACSGLYDRCYCCSGVNGWVSVSIRGVESRAGLPILDTWNPEQRNLIIIDDLMNTTDQRVASLFLDHNWRKCCSCSCFIRPNRPFVSLQGRCDFSIWICPESVVSCLCASTRAVLRK
jgi:hypothetical protein